MRRATSYLAVTKGIWRRDEFWYEQVAKAQAQAQAGRHQALTPLFVCSRRCGQRRLALPCQVCFHDSNTFQGRPSTLVRQEGCDLTVCSHHFQTFNCSATCIDLRAIFHRICVSRLYRARIRKHLPCSSASTRNVPSSRTSNNYANSVLVLLVRWSSLRRSYPLFQMALKVRRSVAAFTDTKTDSFSHRYRALQLAYRPQSNSYGFWYASTPILLRIFC